MHLACLHLFSVRCSHHTTYKLDLICSICVLTKSFSAQTSNFVLSVVLCGVVISCPRRKQGTFTSGPYKRFKENAAKHPGFFPALRTCHTCCAIDSARAAVCMPQVLLGACWRGSQEGGSGKKIKVQGLETICYLLHLLFSSVYIDIAWLDNNSCPLR